MTIPGSTARGPSTARHIVVVEAYDGIAEPLSAEPEERAATRGLGLPLADLAERLRCRITVLTWDEWLRQETTATSFIRWMAYPATRLIAATGSPLAYGVPEHRTHEAHTHGHAEPGAERVRRVPIPARDPATRRAFDAGELSPRSLALLADSDPLFFASYCLDVELRALHAIEPFDVLIVPMWGGLGYVVQMARATAAPGALDIPVAVVVTDTSLRRQRANEEGLWTRPALTRRQSEDLSLALADLVLTFGQRGEEIARAGRPPEAPSAVRVPRAIERAIIDRIALTASRPRPEAGSTEIVIHEPQMPAAGVLAALDAVAMLNRHGIHLERPVTTSGPDAQFAPMKPRGFAEYWSTQGFVRELVHDRQWRWQPARDRRGDGTVLRLYPSPFEHLPDVWNELARGNAVLLSPAASEGLLPNGTIPADLRIDGELDAERVAAALARLVAVGPEQIEEMRRELCELVVDAFRDDWRRRRLDEAAMAIERLVSARPASPSLSRAALLLLDRRRPLRDLAADHRPLHPHEPGASLETGTLTVVVTCYEMGALLPATIESVWSSTRPPDELLLVDDGSHGAETLEAIREVDRDARLQGRPLRVIRQGNLGPARARNRGLAAATGELISFLDGDDLIDSAFYETALTLLRRDPGLGGVAAWSTMFGAGVAETYWNPPQSELPLLLVENTVFVPCVAHTETLRDLGGYDASQRYGYEDWEMSVRLIESGRPIVTIPSYLQQYRMHPSSLLRTMTDVQNQLMREVLLTRHRDTGSRFGPEVAMLLEAQLARFVHADGTPVSPGAAEPGRVQWFLGRARNALVTASGRLARRLHAR